ncbi:MAG: AAA family ATPase, partial [Saprospiraceae bacterium]|nr:AAA family ATPase [Saprospiraceae bacterium]
MSAIKKIFICSSCGVTSPKWIGKCPSCGEWNTYAEEVIQRESKREERQRIWKGAQKMESKPTPLSMVQTGTTQRLITPDDELNRVLGGGIVAGSLILIGGQPGIGKSTLMLQLTLGVSVRVLYVSGEESEEQIKMRADRVSEKHSDCYILTETNTTKIFQHAQSLEPDLIIIDS